MKLSSKMLEVLRELAEPGNFAHYMRYMGQFNPNPYYFMNGSMKHVTAQIKGLVKRGLAEQFDVNPFSDDHKVRITAAGRKYLKSQKVPR